LTSPGSTHQGSALLIIGASARAAAFSALRARLRPECADLFADADLRVRCPVHAVAPGDYPRGLLNVPAWSAAGPWLYTGALENRPGLIEQLERLRVPLWGNGAAVLRRVRSPFEVSRVLRRAGLPCPAVLRSNAPPGTGRWLLKPIAGAGGAGIQLWNGAASPPGFKRPSYFQALVEGDSYAAAFVAESASARLLGVTRQLVGVAWLHAAPFHYCGSVGPLEPDPAQRLAYEALGTALARGFGLRGLFGVDCVVRDGVPYPVEVNPRYTASVEVHEYATGLRALAMHRRVFDPEAPEPPGPHAPAGVVGKAILFARAPLCFPDWPNPLPGVDTLPSFADIPIPGTVIEAGRPVLTLFRRAATVDDCLSELRRQAADLDRRLFGG
jgi:predicted ATP-grasp superfamily ATP-dependent carboligase